MKTMFRASTILPLFGLLASLAACSGQAPTDGTGSTSSSVTTPAPGANAAPAAKPGEHFGGMHHGHGPAGLLFAALHEPIGLTESQRTTIEASLATLKAEAPKPPQEKGQAMEAHKAALVAAIRADKVDPAALAVNDVKPELLDHSAHEAALAKALTTLHDTLSSEQRSLLVMAVEKKMDGGPKGEHGKWGKGPKGEQGPKFEHGKHEGFGPMRMLEGLDLTKEQTAAIEAKLEANEPAPPTEAEIAARKAQHEAMKKEMDARLQTFATETFDAKAFLAKPQGAPDKPAFGKGPMEHMLKDLAVIVPLLTPEQREKLATKIEQGPKAHPHMTAKQ